MKRVSYKVGDIVELVDGVQYVYRGLNKKVRRYVYCYLYEPIEPQEVSIFYPLTDEECEKCKLNKGTVPFAWKRDVDIKLIRRV